MRLAAGLLLLLCGCGHGPYGPFDAGSDVHVILLARSVSSKGLTVEPVCTLGPDVVRSSPRLLQQRVPAAEVAVFRAPKGRQRLAVWDPRTRVRARADLDIEAETWVVMEMKPKQRDGKLHVYDHPPVDEIGPYVLLVPVPD